jgi:hypothetical protein
MARDVPGRSAARMWAAATESNDSDTRAPNQRVAASPIQCKVGLRIGGDASTLTPDATRNGGPEQSGARLAPH